MAKQRPPAGQASNRGRYSSRGEIPSMATPRRPEPPKKTGFMGFVFLIGIFGGLIWLGMLIFGLGPYKPEETPGFPTEASETLSQSQTPFSLATEPFAATKTTNSTLTPTLTPTITLTPTREILPYVLFGEPETMSSALIRPQLDCDWLVIAGQVWDLQGDPVTNSVSVHLFGELDGYVIDLYRTPGTEVAYGESGYEFALEGFVVDSVETLYIQLVDENNLALSHPYLVQTYDNCQQNLILVNFKQVR